MTCPSADKLSQLYDELLTGEEQRLLTLHIETCPSCQHILSLYDGEAAFIKETLQEPSLPEDFAAHVLANVKPYKKKPSYWRRSLGVVAGVTFAVGLTAAMSPGFADFISGVFKQPYIDEGLHMADDAGLVERVDLKVSDAGYTVHVEDVMVDTSRIAFSYKITKESGKVMDPYLDMPNAKNSLHVADENGNTVELDGLMWQRMEDEYGMFQYNLPMKWAHEQLVIQMRVNEIAGEKGQWYVDIPVDIGKIQEQTQLIDLQKIRFEHSGVEVVLDHMRYTPSTTEILYTTNFTERERNVIKQDLEEITTLYGQPFQPLSTTISYTLENEEGEVVGANQIESGETGNMIQGIGSTLESQGHTEWQDTFLPYSAGEKLTFVLDGIVKSIPIDESVTFDVENLAEQPALQLDGQEIIVTSVEEVKDYHGNIPVQPLLKEEYIKLTVQGSRKTTSDQIENWVIQDAHGQSYTAFLSGTYSGPLNEAGDYTIDAELRVYGLPELTDELTLRVTQVSRYEKLAEPWRVKLYE